MGDVERDRFDPGGGLQRVYTSTAIDWNSTCDVGLSGLRGREGHRAS